MHRAVRRAATLLSAALVLSWLAVYNRYPLLYPDSIGYLRNGRLAAAALFLHKFSPQYGGRSITYCLGILPFHCNKSPWPVVGLNAVVTAWVIWLTVASIVPRNRAACFLALTSVLSAFTSLSWFVSLVMPDILGPLLYLIVYLLVFAGDTLSTQTRIALQLIAWWSIASHASHLVLAFGLCAVIAAFVAVEKVPLRSIFGSLRVLSVLIASAALANIALNAYLYGKPSLNGKRPPFLMARVIVDGPGRWYLQDNCGQAKLAICGLRAKVHEGMTDDEFLWDAGGIWKSASPETQERLRAEETRFVLAAIRAHPNEQLHRALANFREQLSTLGLWDYGPNPYIAEAIETVMPGALGHYLQSRQAQRKLPDDFSSTAETWGLAAAIVLIGLVTTALMGRLSRRLLALTVVIISVVIANAFVTGVLSNVEDRYQSRVIWLVPLLAGMYVLEWTQLADSPVLTRRAGNNSDPLSLSRRSKLGKNCPLINRGLARMAIRLGGSFAVISGGNSVAKFRL